MICVEYFFPKHPANSDFESARQLRRCIIPLVVAHVLIACLGMAFVSIITFAVQFLYIAILYSIYMNLRPWIIWMYMILLGFNAASGFFTVFLYEGASFAVYLLILIGYVFMIIKLKQDSAAFRNISEEEGNANNFYLAEGIKHMVNTAREEYPYGRNVLGNGLDQQQNQHPLVQDQQNIQHGRNVNEDFDAYGEPLLQNHYLNQMRENQPQQNNNAIVQNRGVNQANNLRPVAELGMPLIRALGAHIQQQFQQQAQRQNNPNLNQQVNPQGGQGRVDMMNRMYDEEYAQNNNQRPNLR
eukprot:403339460